MEALENLIKLTSLDGVSGDEEAVREFIADRIRDYVDSLEVDACGNLIAFKKGTGEGPRVMLAAHMDEVGMMVTAVNSDGQIKFANVGGIEARVLAGKRVRIGKNKIPGVIGLKPIHAQSAAERKGTVNRKGLTIDIGAKDKDQAEAVVEIGDSVAFDYEPVEFGENKLMAKALDDRCGCAALIELLKNRYEMDVYGCFTVQEEIGLRGAKTAAFRVMPKFALILEGTTCYDVDGTKEYNMSTWLGKGPALTIMDRSVINDRDLLHYVMAIAEKEGIPYQFKKTISGGTDAGRIQANAEGVLVSTMAVPCRYIHTPVSIMEKSDFEGMLKLADSVLKALPEFKTDF